MLGENQNDVRSIKNEHNNSQPTNLELLISIEQIIFNLSNENLESSVQQTMKFFDENFPYSINIIVCYLVYFAFVSKKNLNNIYLIYLKEIQIKEEEMNKNNKIIELFGKYLTKIKSQESNYLLANMIERNLIESKIIENKKNPFFVHLMSETDFNNLRYSYFKKQIIDNYEELSRNDWELHKQLIKEGVNPNEIAKIIRNDEIEKLQEISSQTNFDFNQIIKPSLYERCDFINKKMLH